MQCGDVVGAAAIGDKTRMARTSAVAAWKNQMWGKLAREVPVDTGELLRTLAAAVQTSTEDEMILTGSPITNKYFPLAWVKAKSVNKQLIRVLVPYARNLLKKQVHQKLKAAGLDPKTVWRGA